MKLGWPLLITPAPWIRQCLLSSPGIWAVKTSWWLPTFDAVLAEIETQWSEGVYQYFILVCKWLCMFVHMCIMYIYECKWEVIILFMFLSHHFYQIDMIGWILVWELPLKIMIEWKMEYTHKFHFHWWCNRGKKTWTYV